MVSLRGDVAPERRLGFYSQIAPAAALMDRQYHDIPPLNFLQTQSGYFAGIPASRKLENIDGFFNSSTNYLKVQDAPHFLRMRKARLEEHARKRALEEIESHRNAVHSARKTQTQLREERKRRRQSFVPYKSEAAGLKLKQAMRMVKQPDGTYKLQKETVIPDDISQFPTGNANLDLYKAEVARLLRKIGGEPPTEKR
jgi:hypothetical protein